jgi:hypothetical protein
LSRERIGVSDILAGLPKEGKDKDYPASKFINENIDEAFKTLDVYLKCLKHEQNKWVKTGRKITDKSVVRPVYKSLRKIYKTCRQNMELLDKAVTQSFIEYFPDDETKVYFEDELASKCTEDIDPSENNEVSKTLMFEDANAERAKEETPDTANKTNAKPPVKLYLPMSPTKPSTPNNKAPAKPSATPTLKLKESSPTPSPATSKNKTKPRPPRKRPSKPTNPPAKVAKPRKPIDDDSDIEIVDIDDRSYVNGYHFFV